MAVTPPPVTFLAPQGTTPAQQKSLERLKFVTSSPTAWVEQQTRLDGTIAVHTAIIGGDVLLIDAEGFPVRETLAGLQRYTTVWSP